MSKYSPLYQYLAAQAQTQRIRMTFAEVEAVIGARLPRSAFTYPEWWANQKDTSNRPQAAAWQDAGFLVSSLRQDADSGTVVFTRK